MAGYKGNLDNKTYQAIEKETIRIINEYVDNNKDVCDIGCYDDYLVDKIKYKTICLVDLEFDKVVQRYWNSNEEHNLIYIEKDINDFLEYAIKEEITFDVIIMGSLVEHLTHHQRDSAFYKIRKILNESGILIITYPNCKSLNRLLGVEMNIIPHAGHLGSGDIRVGHKAMYSWNALRQFEGGLKMKLIREEGIMFKPLPNSMMDKYFGHELDLFIDIGKKLGSPYCGLILGIYQKIF